MSKNYHLQNLINNLEYYGITFDEFKANFKYAGGDTDRHNRYFILCYKEGDRPDYCNYCLCDHYIKENCYITDGKQFIVLGNCCIKRFLPKCTRTCEDCGKPHRNRTVNKCSECKFGKCENCGKKCTKGNSKCKECKKLCDCGAKSYKYGKCFTCCYGKPCENCNKLHLNKIVNRCNNCRIGVCDECGKKCKPCFEKCYTCAYLKK